MQKIKEGEKLESVEKGGKRKGYAREGNEERHDKMTSSIIYIVLKWVERGWLVM